MKTHSPVTARWWMFNSTPLQLYSLENSGAFFMGGWVDLGVGLAHNRFKDRHRPTCSEYLFQLR